MHDTISLANLPHICRKLSYIKPFRKYSNSVKFRSWECWKQFIFCEANKKKLIIQNCHSLANLLNMKVTIIKEIPIL